MKVTKEQLIIGNKAIAEYLYGSPRDGAYTIGYARPNSTILLTRKYNEEFCEDIWINYHNDWNLLHQVVAKIAKDNFEPFSKEERYFEAIKEAMARNSMEPIYTWYQVVSYIEYVNKLIT